MRTKVEVAGKIAGEVVNGTYITIRKVDKFFGEHESIVISNKILDRKDIKNIKIIFFNGSRKTIYCCTIRDFKEYGKSWLTYIHNHGYDEGKILHIDWMDKEK